MTLKIRSQVKGHGRNGLKIIREDVKLFKGQVYQALWRSADPFARYSPRGCITPAPPPPVLARVRLCQSQLFRQSLEAVECTDAASAAGVRCEGDPSVGRMSTDAATGSPSSRVNLERANNFMRQFRDAESRQLKKLTANQFMEVWSHYDADGESSVRDGSNAKIKKHWKSSRWVGRSVGSLKLKKLSFSENPQGLRPRSFRYRVVPVNEDKLSIHTKLIYLWENWYI